MTHTLGAGQWRALARSSPWLWRTGHFELTRMGSSDPVRVEAWLDRRVALRVEAVGARPIVQVREPRTASWYGWGSNGNPESGTRVEPDPWEVEVLTNAEGLVVQRPPTAATAEDLMWQDYQWVAMLDPVELADPSPDRSGPATRIDRAWVDERAGRVTWWAELREGPGYDPRCTCCPLLDGSVADRLLADESGAKTHVSPTGLPTRWLVGLDCATGIVVSLQPLDGDSVAGGFELTLLNVDDPVTIELD